MMLSYNKVTEYTITIQKCGPIVLSILATGYRYPDLDKKIYLCDATYNHNSKVGHATL